MEREAETGLAILADHPMILHRNGRYADRGGRSSDWLQTIAVFPATGRDIDHITG